MQVLSVLLFAFMRVAGADGLQAAETETAARDEQRALQLFYGKGRPVDRDGALILFERGAKVGRPISQWMIALELLRPGASEQGLARAAELATAAANQGLADAQALLGWMYVSGRGVGRDPKAAAKWFASAVRQEHPRAMFSLGQLYATGDGLEQREDIAHDLFRRAAELGEPYAMVQFATAVWYGKHERRDLAIGRYFLEKSAGVGNEHAAFLLARSHLLGDRLPQDFSRAAQWMNQAADKQHPLALLWMSELYAKGLGVNADAEKAQQLLVESLSKANVAAKNDFAWELAVSPNARLRNGSLAVRVMTEALRDPAARRPAYLDTLAAAYAETGDFNAAIEMQQQALAVLAQQTKKIGTNPGMLARLDDYKAGKAFRELRQ